MHPKPNRYRSRRGTPECVKLWDRVFRSTGHWLDWMVAQGLLLHEVKRLIADSSFSKEEAMDMVWNAFCAAAHGVENTPVNQIYQDLCDGVLAPDLPEFVMWMTIGVDVHLGKSEAQAQADYVTWLSADISNQYFPEGWRMLPSLVVINEESPES